MERVFEIGMSSPRIMYRRSWILSKLTQMITHVPAMRLLYVSLGLMPHSLYLEVKYTFINFVQGIHGSPRSHASVFKTFVTCRTLMACQG